MSTLKAINIQHPSSTGTNIVLNSANGTNILGQLTLQPVGSEGGEIRINNPDGLYEGMIIDVGSANTARIFSTQTNMDMQIGQLVGTGGRIGFFTGTTERMRVASDGSFSAVVESGSTLYPSYWCRAWIRFTTSVGVPSISNDGNVTSITDNGTGNFVINFTTALPDANFAAVANYSESNSATGSGNDGQASCHTYATGSVSVFCARGDGSANDPARCSVAVFR